MKYLFFLLVFANVLLFLWEDRTRGFHPDADSAHRELPLPGAVERIALLSERPAVPKATDEFEEAEMALQSKLNAEAEQAESSRPEQPPQPPEPVPAPPVTVTDCYQMGPFSTRSAATELLGLIKPHAREAAIGVKPSDVADGWWVLIPKAESMEAAKAKRQMLQEKGVRDFWLFNKGELQGAISLGLFQSRDKAETAQKQFMEKNIISEVVPRSVRAEAYWIRIPWTRPALDLDEVVQTLKMENSELRIPAPVPCN
jgi:hypothetical protein